MSQIRSRTFRIFGRDFQLDTYKYTTGWAARAGVGSYEVELNAKPTAFTFVAGNLLEVRLVSVID